MNSQEPQKEEEKKEQNPLARYRPTRINGRINNPTALQIATVERLRELGGNVPIGRAMIDVGYSESTARSPAKLTRSPTFIQLCEEAGLTDDFLLGALKHDIEHKPKNRKAELELAFKVKGRLKEREENPFIQNNVIVFDNDQLSRIARRISDGNTPSQESSN